MKHWHRVPCLCALLALAWLSTSAAARPHDPKVTVAVEEATTSIHEGRVTATFKIRLTNDENTTVTNAFVEYRDGNGVFIGDVKAQASALSATETRSFDADIPHSRSHVLPVTIKFSLDGEPKQIGTALLFEVK